MDTYLGGGQKKSSVRQTNLERKNLCFFGGLPRRPRPNMAERGLLTEFPKYILYLEVTNSGAKQF